MFDMTTRILAALVASGLTLTLVGMVVSVAWSNLKNDWGFASRRRQR